MAAVVCREKTTASPSATPDRATMRSTCSVRSMNSGAVVVTTSIDSDQQAKPAPVSIAGRGDGFKTMTRELLHIVDRVGKREGAGETRVRTSSTRGALEGGERQFLVILA